MRLQLDERRADPTASLAASKRRIDDRARVTARPAVVLALLYDLADLNGLLCYHSTHRSFDDRVAELQLRGFEIGASLLDTGLQSLVRKSGAVRLLPPRLREMEAMLGPAQGGILRWTAPQVTPARGPVRYRVGFIEGCIMPQLFGDTNAATVRVLAANGCVVFSPPKQGCCGALQMHTGDRETARDLARRNIDAFEGLGLDAIIINAAGCGSTLKEYGHLLSDDPAYAERAAGFTAKMKDVSEFLASIDLVPPTRPVPMRVTYQDACHLVHGQGIRNQPRKLLRQIPGLELVEMKDSDVCCGSAGIYNLTHYDVSMKVLEQKMDNVLATDAAAIVAPNPGCTMQLAYGLRRRGANLKLYHVVDLLDMAYP